MTDTITKYLEHCETRSFRPTSLQQTRNVLLLIQRDLDLLTADSAAVMALMASWRVAPETRGFRLSTLSGFMRWAVTTGLRHDDPTELIPRPKVRRYLPRPISTPDLLKGLQLADPRMRALLACGALAGLRCMEMAGLHGDDVRDDLPEPTIYVADGKGGRQRSVPAPQMLLDCLAAYRLPKGHRPIFLQALHDAPMSASDMSGTISRYFTSIGVRATAHQLRHWYATNIYAASRDLRLVQELLGHAHPQTTAIYTAVDMGLAAPVVDTLAELLAA